MIESQLRALFTGIADGEPAPSRVDAQRAHRLGRSRLRRRRAAAAVTPVAAAVAVVALIGALTTFGAAQPGPRTDQALSGGTSAPLAAPRSFDPTTPYARFGWLPAHRQVTSVTTAAGAEIYEVGGEASATFVGLDVYLPGSCDHTASQLLALLRDRQQPQLACTLRWGPNGGGNPTLSNPVTAAAPPVNGQQAFWAEPVCNTNQCDPGASGSAILMWNYAPGAWAVLHDQSQAQALEIADRIVFGPGAAQPVRFPAQLTGVPSTWQVTSVQAGTSAGVTAAQQWYADNTYTAPSFTVAPASPGQGCDLEPASAVRHEVINGYDATVTTTAKGTQVCVTDDDGLYVYLFTGAGVTPAAPDVFAHHLKLLGPDPARWTTHPIA